MQNSSRKTVTDSSTTMNNKNVAGVDAITRRAIQDIMRNPNVDQTTKRIQLQQFRTGKTITNGTNSHSISAVTSPTKDATSVTTKAMISTTKAENSSNKNVAVAIDPDEMKNNIQVITDAVTQNGRALEYPSHEMKNNIEIVLAAVKQNGRALQFASHEMRDNKEIVTAAVTQYGRALEFASEELKSDKEVVLNAVRQNGEALEFASEEMKNNQKVVTAAVMQNPLTLNLASDEMKYNIEVVTAAVESSQELKNNQELGRAAVIQNGEALDAGMKQRQIQIMTGKTITNGTNLDNTSAATSPTKHATSATTKAMISTTKDENMIERDKHPQQSHNTSSTSAERRKRDQSAIAEQAVEQDSWKKTKSESLSKALDECDVAPFVLKTKAMITKCNTEYPHIATWNKDGDKIIINNQEEFAKKVIPQFFDHNKFPSFVRQLNNYGFRKIQRTNIHKNDQIVDNSEQIVIFSHEFFHRDKPELMKKIIKGQKDKGRQDKENTQKKINALEKMIASLEQDKQQMRQEYEHRFVTLKKGMLSQLTANSSSAAQHAGSSTTHQVHQVHNSMAKEINSVHVDSELIVEEHPSNNENETNLSNEEIKALEQTNKDLQQNIKLIRQDFNPIDNKNVAGEDAIKRPIQDIMSNPDLDETTKLLQIQQIVTGKTITNRNNSHSTSAATSPTKHATSVTTKATISTSKAEKMIERDKHPQQSHNTSSTSAETRRLDLSAFVARLQQDKQQMQETRNEKIKAPEQTNEDLQKNIELMRQDFNPINNTKNVGVADASRRAIKYVMRNPNLDQKTKPPQIQQIRTAKTMDDEYEIAPFVLKTKDMINKCNECYPDIAAWHKDGDKIIINNQEEFARTVIPQFFDHNKFPSFVRQLNNYGFKKVQKTKMHKNDQIVDNSEQIVIFSHEFFHRDKPDLMKKIKKGQKDKGRQDKENLEKEINALKEKVASLELNNENLQETTKLLQQGLQRFEHRFEALEKGICSDTLLQFSNDPRTA